MVKGAYIATKSNFTEQSKEKTENRVLNMLMLKTLKK